jgi:drug/metabolite transporter (DMT)-like permease
MHATFLGWIAAFGMVFIGAGWQLATRFGATGGFHPLDLAVLRYVVPALLLAPVWWRLLSAQASAQASVQPRRSWRHLALLVIGSGLPFGLLVMTGARYAPVSHMAALLPGLIPLMVIAGGSALARKLPARMQMLAAAVVFLGVSLVSGMWSTVGNTQVWLGDALFVCAAVLWSVYSLAFRSLGLTGWQGAALVSFWSALAVVPLWLWQADTKLWSVSMHALLLQVAWQGVLAGTLGIAAYGYAMRVLGPARPAVVGALVPVVSSIGGVWLLGEKMDTTAWCGVALVTAGIAAITMHNSARPSGQ